MTAWPTVEELTTVLNLEGWESDDVRLTTTVPRALATAIDYVKLKRGRWVEGTDAPDEALSNAALRMAQLLLLAPGAEPDTVSDDPTFRRSMFGRRRRFGLA